MKDIYSIRVKKIDGTETTLDAYKGSVLLIVNTASKCGFTPQYKGLNELYKKFHNQGFEVLGFPCNQFGEQEPGSDQEIKEFCDLSYKIEFPMFSKVDVNGSNTHPLYEHLKSESPGILGTQGIKWNFTKFLVGRDGKVLHRFAPQDAPEKLTGPIQEALGI